MLKCTEISTISALKLSMKILQNMEGLHLLFLDEVNSSYRVTEVMVFRMNFKKTLHTHKQPFE